MLRTPMKNNLVKKFAKFIIEDELKMSDSAKTLYDEIIPRLKPIQLVNYYDASGSERNDEMHDHVVKMEELSKILSNPNIQQDHFNEVMHTEVPFYARSGEETGLSSKKVPIYELIGEIFDKIPLELSQTFVDAIPRHHFPKRWSNYYNKDSVRKAYVKMMEHPDHTPETFMRAMEGAHFRNIHPETIRRTLFNSSPNLQTPEIMDYLRKINEYDNIGNIFRREPYKSRRPQND